MRRSVAWGVAAVVLSSAVVSVARAEVSPSAGSPLSRPEAALGSGSRQVPPLPAGSAPTVAAGVPVVGAAPAGFVAGRSVEVPAGRDVFETLYGNPDGSNTVVVSSEPVHYLADGRWEQINNRLVVDEDGSIRNAANAWSVRFGATLADGVSVTVGGESVSWSAEGAAPARAVVEPDGVSVRYADAWLGVDLVYRVRGGAVEELLVLKRPDATSSFDFVLDALVRPVGSGLEVSKGSMRVGVAAPETFDAAGVVVDAVAGTRQQVTASDIAASVVRVGVDGRWLAGLAADRFPVTIDPTVMPSLPYLIAYPTPGQGYTQLQDGYARVGNPVVSGKPNLRWRSIGQFDYWSGVNNMLGKRVSNATVTLNAVSGSSSTAYGVTAFWADTFGYHDTVAPRVLPPPYPYGNSWTPDFGSASLGGAGSSASINVTSLYDFWTRSSMIGGTLLFRGNETAGLYTIKKFTVSLSITYVEAPAAPTLGAVTNPANGTRWLSVPAFLTTSQSSDPDTTAGDLRYRVEVGTDASFSSGVEYTSSWWPYYTFPPVGALFLRDQDFRFLDPGQGYWWRIAVTDGWYTVASTESRSFTWDPDPAVAPTDSQGPFTLNLATGLATTGVSTPSFESVGGPIGAEVAYSSHTKAAVGLVRQAWRDLNANGVVDAGDVRVERRVDATVDRDWASGGVTGDGVDNFLVQWSGVITAGAAGWQLGIECDQRAKVTIAGVTVIDKTASDCSAVANSGAIDWATGTLSTSPASLLVEFRETTGTARARLWIRQGTGAPQRVESSWFTPSGTKVLPAGWTFAGGPAALGWVHAQVDVTS